MTFFPIPPQFVIIFQQPKQSLLCITVPSSGGFFHKIKAEIAKAWRTLNECCLLLVCNDSIYSIIPLIVCSTINKESRLLKQTLPWCALFFHKIYYKQSILNQYIINATKTFRWKKYNYICFITSVITGLTWRSVNSRPDTPRCFVFSFVPEKKENHLKC